MIRYLFAALASATVLPAVEKIGVGWFSTVSAGFLIASSLATGAAVVWGRRWRDRVDNKRREERRKKLEKGSSEKEAGGRKEVRAPAVEKKWKEEDMV